jgi:hypothetical protein
MRTLDSATLTALAGGNVGLAQLVEMSLSYEWRINTSSWNLTWNSLTYLGVQAALGRIDVIDESPGEVKGLRFELPAVASADRAIALAEPVQGKTVIVRTAIFDASTFAILEAPIEWEGRLDTMSIVQREVNPGTVVPVVQVTAEHIGIDLLRPSGYQYTKQDQLRRYPGDLSFEYVTAQSDQQIVFPAASFFRK